MTTCVHCHEPFEPKRPHHKFCKPSCRQAHFDAHPLTEGTAATVKTLRILKSGKVSAVMHFGQDERERALKLTPGQLVSVA